MTVLTRRPRHPSTYLEEVAIAIRIEAAMPVHWKCPDCFVPCRCTGDARLMPHQRCGLAAERR